MGALIHAKKVKGQKIWYAWGAEGNTKWERTYPECKSRSEFYEALRKELGLPATFRKTDIFIALLSKTWTGQQWEDDFSLRLKALREKAEFTQGALADKAGLSVQAISALESGTRAPSWETVRRLAFALGVPETEFKDTLPKDKVVQSMKEFV
jgi:DNA-binding XRE family transcriptional regulator